MVLVITQLENGKNITKNINSDITLIGLIKKILIFEKEYNYNEKIIELIKNNDLYL